MPRPAHTMPGPRRRRLRAVYGGARRRLSPAPHAVAPPASGAAAGDASVFRLAIWGSRPRVGGSVERVAWAGVCRGRPGHYGGLRPRGRGAGPPAAVRVDSPMSGEIIRSRGRFGPASGPGGVRSRLCRACLGGDGDQIRSPAGASRTGTVGRMGLRGGAYGT